MLHSWNGSTRSFKWSLARWITDGASSHKSCGLTKSISRSSTLRSLLLHSPGNLYWPIGMSLYIHAYARWCTRHYMQQGWNWTRHWLNEKWLAGPWSTEPEDHTECSLERADTRCQTCRVLFQPVQVTGGCICERGNGIVLSETIFGHD